MDSGGGVKGPLFVLPRMPLLQKSRRGVARVYPPNTPTHSRGALRPSDAKTFIAQKIEGVGNAGCQAHPQPRVRIG
jgi:hypothetical protein